MVYETSPAYRQPLVEMSVEIDHPGVVIDDEDAARGLVGKRDSTP